MHTYHPHTQRIHPFTPSNYAYLSYNHTTTLLIQLFTTSLVSISAFHIDIITCPHTPISICICWRTTVPTHAHIHTLSCLLGPLLHNYNCYFQISFTFHHFSWSSYCLIVYGHTICNYTYILCWLGVYVHLCMCMCMCIRVLQGVDDNVSSPAFHPDFQH
jgi:hypothetical protein